VLKTKSSNKLYAIFILLLLKATLRRWTYDLLTGKQGFKQFTVLYTFAVLYLV